jgi:hypothetical protein
MNTETMERPAVAAPVAALTPPQRAAVALNTAEYEIKLRELLTNSVGILTVTNKAGRDECHSAYMVLKNTRCAITNLSEDATEDAKAFTKAVKAEAARLIAITTAEEERLQGLRDAWDEAEQARKDALIAAEKERVEAIQARIADIVAVPVKCAFITSSRDISDEFAALGDMAIDDSFAEFRDAATSAVTQSLARLQQLFDKAKEAEAAALAAEEARQAEAARIAAEREELAQLRAAAAEHDRLAKIEAERVAAEQAAEARRLAAIAAEQDRQREAEAARVRAEQEAQAAETRRQQEAIAEQQRQLAAQQAAFAAEQEAALQRVEAAAKLEADHAEGLIIDAQVNGEREAERARLQSLADQHLADGRERAKDEQIAGLPAGALSIAALDTVSDIDPTDDEIIDAMVEAFGMDRAQSVERLARFDFAGQRELAEAA